MYPFLKDHGKETKGTQKNTDSYPLYPAVR